MASKSRRLIALGAFAVAAAAGPAIAAATISTSAPQALPPDCLAHFGNAEDNVCLGVSNGQPINAGTPWQSVWGPNGPNGVGVTTGGLIPGQTITQGVN